HRRVGCKPVEVTPLLHLRGVLRCSDWSDVPRHYRRGKLRTKPLFESLERIRVEQLWLGQFEEVILNRKPGRAAAAYQDSILDVTGASLREGDKIERWVALGAQRAVEARDDRCKHYVEPRIDVATCNPMSAR